MPLSEFLSIRALLVYLTKFSQISLNLGHVFTKGEAVNIYNAYTDERFNKAIDIKTGYKTNTILTVPIRDDSLKVIGIWKII